MSSRTASLSRPTAMTSAAAPREVAGWVVTEWAEVESTQEIARKMPAWSAVVAAVQRRGRGQYDRSFTSDRGGFYLTAVLPFDGKVAASRGFALAVGWAICVQLRELAGGPTVRLRWPNDLMVGPRKIGGILVEQASRSTLAVGVGINVTNEPWVPEPALRGIAGTLRDCAGLSLEGPAQLLEPILRSIRRAQDEFSRVGFAGLTTAINGCWGREGAVELELVGTDEPRTLCGIFAGIDPHGCVLLKSASGALLRVPEHHIRRLREA